MTDKKETNSADRRGVIYVTMADWGDDMPIDRPLGVYSTFEKARAAAQSRLKHFYGVDVYEVNIDEPDSDGFGNPVWYWNQQNKKGGFLDDAEQRFQR